METVVINDQGFTIYDYGDHLTFKDESARDDDGQLVTKIDKSEILFVKKSNLEQRHFNLQCPVISRRSSKKSLFRLLTNKKLKILARNESDPQSLKSTMPNNNSLTLFAVMRAKSFKWRISFVVCNFKDETTRDLWYEKLNRGLNGDESRRPKRLLVFVNPFGGKGKAKQISRELVEPLLRLSNIEFKLIMTERANHAHDLMLDGDFANVDGILSVGGDGLFSEILNGLLLKVQRDAKIDVNDKNAQLRKPSRRLAAIPAGSTNAFACTLNGTDDPLTAMLHVIVGDQRRIDICAVHAGQKFDRFACIAASYGFMGDVLECSEKMRFLGPPRYLFAGLKMTCKHPLYCGKIELRQAKEQPQAECNVLQSNLPVNVCHSECKICKAAERVTKGSENAQKTMVLDDVKLIHLVGVITPAICKLSPAGLSPTCHLGDGMMHVAWTSPISRLRNGLFIARIIRKNKDHLSMNFVKAQQATGFSFTSLKSDRSVDKKSKDVEEKETLDINDHKGKYGVWNVDGEIFYQPAGTIHFTMHKQLISMFARGIELEYTKS